MLEALEDRCCPSFLLVADFGGDKVLRYERATGAFVDTFVRKQTGGLNQPYGILIRAGRQRRRAARPLRQYG
jgi:hypothetical protein